MVRAMSSGQVPYDLRVNRATVAVFRFESGAVGSLNHTLLMHGQNFFTELDIYGDGFHIIVRDPYQKPAVILRRPLSNDYEQVRTSVHVMRTCCADDMRLPCTLISVFHIHSEASEVHASGCSCTSMP
jgi:hypothetical protein